MGCRESDVNYDGFFENLESNERTEIDANTVTITNTELKMLYEIVQTSVKKIQSLENYIAKLDDHIIRLDVQIRNMSTIGSYSSSKSKPKTVELATLKTFGLPVETEAELRKLEAKLKNDDEWKKELVSCLIFVFSLIFQFIN